MTALSAEHFDEIKMLLRSKSLIFQAFLRRVIVLRDGPCPLALSHYSISAVKASFFDSLRKKAAFLTPPSSCNNFSLY